MPQGSGSQNWKLHPGNRHRRKSSLGQEIHAQDISETSAEVFQKRGQEFWQSRLKNLASEINALLEIHQDLFPVLQPTCEELASMQKISRGNYISREKYICLIQKASEMLMTADHYQGMLLLLCFNYYQEAIGAVNIFLNTTMHLSSAKEVGDAVLEEAKTTKAAFHFYRFARQWITPHRVPDLIKYLPRWTAEWQKMMVAFDFPEYLIKPYQAWTSICHFVQIISPEFQTEGERYSHVCSLVFFSMLHEAVSFICKYSAYADLLQRQVGKDHCRAFYVIAFKNTQLMNFMLQLPSGWSFNAQNAQQKLNETAGFLAEWINVYTDEHTFDHAVIDCRTAVYLKDLHQREQPEDAPPFPQISTQKGWREQFPFQALNATGVCLQISGTQVATMAALLSICQEVLYIDNLNGNFKIFPKFDENDQLSWQKIIDDAETHKKNVLLVDRSKSTIDMHFLLRFFDRTFEMMTFIYQTLENDISQQNGRCSKLLQKAQTNGDYAKRATEASRRLVKMAEVQNHTIFTLQSLVRLTTFLHSKRAELFRPPGLSLGKRARRIYRQNQPTI